MSEILIGKKKLDGHVNELSSSYEVEIPFFKDCEKLTSITIDGKKHDIQSIINVGDRSEVIKILVNIPSEDNNEQKQVKGRNDTDN